MIFELLVIFFTILALLLFDLDLLFSCMMGQYPITSFVISNLIMVGILVFDFLMGYLLYSRPRFLIYFISFLLIGIGPPPFIISTVVDGLENEFGSYYTRVIKINALFYSYAMNFSYLLPICIHFTIFFKMLERVLAPVKLVERNEKVERCCEMLSKKMNIEKPRIFLTKKPMLYTFGHDENKATIVIFEKCAELDDRELSAILTHEFTHIKSDIGFHTLKLLFSGAHPSWLSISYIPFIVIALFGVYNLILLSHSTVDRMYVQDYFASFYTFILMLIPFLLLLSSEQIFKFLINSALPSLELEEFKIDLLSYLELNDANLLCRSLDRFRRIQILYYVENPILKRTCFHKIAIFYMRLMKKGFFSKDYPSWLEYFRETYTKLELMLKMGFDYPKDHLRKSFIKFIDKLCNDKMVLRMSNKLNIDALLREMDKKKSFKKAIRRDRLAFVAWLEADLHKISKEDIEKVINNITSTHVCFNAKNCSEATGVPLYYVLVIFLAFLVDGQLYVESEISGNSA